MTALILTLPLRQVSHTSDHFAYCEKLARQMISEGLAYMDDTPQEKMQVRSPPDSILVSCFASVVLRAGSCRGAVSDDAHMIETRKMRPLMHIIVGLL